MLEINYEKLFLHIKNESTKQSYMQSLYFYGDICHGNIQ